MMHPSSNARLERDLQVDKALSEAQLERHYDVRLGDLPGTLHTVQHSLSPTKGSAQPALVTFVCTSQRIARRQGRKLQHLAGLAEMRHLLGARPETWVSYADASHGVAEADGEWDSPDGRIAVEYDIGSYSTAYILEKAHSLERKGYARLIWGCPSERLVRSRQKTLGKVGLEVRVLYARWC